jgi:hypothetical protein
MANLNIELSMAKLLKHAARTPDVSNAVVTHDTMGLHFWCSVSSTNEYVMADRKHPADKPKFTMMAVFTRER